MAAIISIRHYKPGHLVLWEWLSNNVNKSNYVIDKISMTFINDEDATAFCLRFGIPAATHNPGLLNRLHE